MEIKDSHQFDINEMGKWTIKGTYKGKQTNTIELEVIGPNLRSTELDNTHLFFRTSDNKFLCVKE